MKRSDDNTKFIFSEKITWDLLNRGALRLCFVHHCLTVTPSQRQRIIFEYIVNFVRMGQVITEREKVMER